MLARVDVKANKIEFYCHDLSLMDLFTVYLIWARRGKLLDSRMRANVLCNRAECCSAVEFARPSSLLPRVASSSSFVALFSCYLRPLKTFQLSFLLSSPKSVCWRRSTSFPSWRKALLLPCRACCSLSLPGTFGALRLTRQQRGLIRLKSFSFASRFIFYRSRFKSWVKAFLWGEERKKREKPSSASPIKGRKAKKKNVSRVSHAIRRHNTLERQQADYLRVNGVVFIMHDASLNRQTSSSSRCHIKDWWKINKLSKNAFCPSKPFSMYRDGGRAISSTRVVSKVCFSFPLRGN